jgi:hypothetical protein
MENTLMRATRRRFVVASVLATAGRCRAAAADIESKPRRFSVRACSATIDTKGKP